MTVQKFICVDLETTGTTPDEGAEVIELGATEVSVTEDGGILVEFPSSAIFAPKNGIPPATSAVHGFMECDFDGKKYFDRADVQSADKGIFVAHNAKFERQWIDDPSIEWICTYKCAMAVWPDAPAHNLGTLLYWLARDATTEHFYVAGLRVRRLFVQRFHRAGPDSYANAFILAALLKEHPVEALIEISSNPLLLNKVTFGKHSGSKWSEVPKDYLQWITKQDFDEDVIYTARHWLNA